MDISGTPTVSFIYFNYRLNKKIKNGSSRTIEIGTTDRNGNFSLVQSIVLDKNTPTTVQSFFSPLALSTGVQRFTIRVTIAGDDNKSYLVFDDLSITSASQHYSNGCNTAPTASNTAFNAVKATAYSGDLSSLASDADPGETLTFSVVDAPTARGTLVLNSNGTFTFTPAGGFIGGAVTFTYKVTDNGYDPLSSNKYTVTINYPDQAPLPIHFVSFTGSVVNAKAQLAWSVAENEDGDKFQIEKSTDGTNFSLASIVMNTAKQGSETYSYTDASFSGTTYYRLKAINKTGSYTYSRTIVLKANGYSKQNNLLLTQNPVVSSLNFNYTATASGSYIINLYNTAGVKVYTSQVTMQKGLNASSLSFDNRIAPGAYIIEVSNGSDHSTAKLIKQ
ncbi:MAG: hypothetical protein C4330_04090 [Chitinophagaceae bacterium]